MEEDTTWHYVQHYDSPLGGILLAADESGITGLWFDGQKYFARDLPAERVEQKHTRARGGQALAGHLFCRGRAGLYAAAAPRRLRVPAGGVDIFCCRFPMDRPRPTVRSRGSWPRQQGLARMSAQAVGGAVGHNEISIIIPCHRVVGTSGSLTGYAGRDRQKSEAAGAGAYRHERFFRAEEGHGTLTRGRTGTCFHERRRRTYEDRGAYEKVIRQGVSPPGV